MIETIGAFLTNEVKEMQSNIILNTDGYKLSHYLQYPPGTEKVYCYIEARKPFEDYDRTLYFGLQAYLIEYLVGRVVDTTKIEEAETVFAPYGVPYNKAGWQYIRDHHDGRLPITIKAVQEGTVLPVSNVMVTIENTDPACFWLPTYLETSLLRAVWYPTTVATVSYECRKTIYAWLKGTCDDPDGQIDFKLHDFGGRGVSSEESAGLGGAAHLINFKGSDTISGILAAQRYYSAGNCSSTIPASEHSTIITWGRAREAEAYANMLDQFSGDGKIVACVSDSYDLWSAVRDIWCGTLKERVKHSGGTLVIRPDSGDPEKVVHDTLGVLGEHFGYTTNSKGYKVLPSYVRLIQGDGVDEETIRAVLTRAAFAGWSAENVAFGMGGALLQQVNRDTFSFAMKPSHVTINGEGRNVWKAPADDIGKTSKRGRFGLVREPEWDTISEAEAAGHDELQEVFRDGKLVATTNFAQVRERARATE